MNAAEILRTVIDADGTSADDPRSNQVKNFGPALALAQDVQLARLVSVWPSVPVSSFDGAAVCPPETPKGLREVRWLWAQLKPDPVPTWIEVAGLPDNPHTRRLAGYAIDNRLVRPDGSLSTWAQTTVRTVLVAILEAGGKKKRS